MGVDVQTYRCRIGTFGHGIGSGISTTEHVMDFTHFSKSIGTVLFIGTLLLMAGIEPNPGPKTDVATSLLESDVANAIRKFVYCTRSGPPEVYEAIQISMDNINRPYISDTDSTPEVSQRCPEFVTRPEELNVTAGTSAVLICCVSGEPPPSVVWLKETTPVKHGKQYKTSSIGDEHFLEILNCGQSDSGQYTCNLSNVAGTASASASVIVEDTCQPTFYSTDLRSQEFLDTSKLSNIESIQSNFFEVSGKRLSTKAFNDPSSKDSKCGTTMTVDQFNNTPHNETEPEFMTVDQSNKTPQSETKQEFVTVDQSNKTPLCETEPEFVTVNQSNKTPLCETEPNFVTGDQSSKAILKETEPECLTVDQSNKTLPSKRKSEFVTGDQSYRIPLNETKPEFVRELENQTVSYGSEVILECRVTGTPLPEIYWTFNDIKVKQSKHFKTVYHERSAKLVIAEAFTEDEGKYTCIAKNTKGASTTTCKLAVKDQPMEGALRSILEKLKLDNMYPGKIQMSDVLSLSIKSYSPIVSHADIPWIFIRSVILSNSDCRDTTVADILTQLEKGSETESDNDSDDSIDLSRNTKNDGISISPLDIFYVVMQCCDPLVQSLLYKKLYLCKIAVPFMCWETSRQHKVLSLWPLRSVVIEKQGQEYSAIQWPTHTVAFARFGRPKFSKSNFLNHFLTVNCFDIFYNKDCPLGFVKRHIGNECVEIFWTLSETDNVTVFNLRGDISTHYKKSDICIVSELADILTVCVELENIHLFRDELDNMLEHFKRIVLIVNNPPHKDLQEQEDILRKIKGKNNIKKMVTFQNETAISPRELTKKLNKILSNWYKTLPLLSVEQRLSKYCLKEHLKDVYDQRIARIEHFAKSFIQRLEEESDDDKRRQILTPASCSFSKIIANKIRDTFKANVKDPEKIKTEIEGLRDRQKSSVHTIMQTFASKIVSFESIDDLLLYLAWVSELLETKQRQILPLLRGDNKREFEKLCSLQDENQNSETLTAQRKKVKNCGDAIYEAVFSVSHLFSELNHIYEACIQNKIYGIPDLPLPQKYLTVIADLMIKGYPFELLNGDSMYLTVACIERVFHNIHQKLGRSKVFPLSVLGLQGSGKSTLLNTMFGSNFAVSAGRCTKGIHIQLLPVSGKNMPFNYLLLIDTEGLRAPELENDTFNHDNELYTFVTGLGDTTILNIMGENMSELSNTLQIMVHAFLRLKLANNRLDIKKKCIFVYQCVSDTAAPAKMHRGLQTILTTLDTMTQEAASSEGISDIFRFNQVIDFNITTDVWYFPDLWKGGPSFASVNKKYSEKARDLRQHILKQAVQAENKSYKSLDDIYIQINDLWKGVSQENFVFSFRNSLAIKAYCFLHKELKQIVWKHEQIVVNFSQQHASETFAKCRDITALDSELNKVNEVIDKKHIKEGLEGRTSILNIFVESNFKDIISEWKDTTEIEFNTNWKDLLYRCKHNVHLLYISRNADLKIATLMINNEQRLYYEPKKVALSIRDKGVDNREETLKEFEKLWQQFILDIPTESKTQNMHELFQKIIRDKLENDSALYQKIEKETNWPNCDQTYKSLKEWFNDFKVRKDDLSILWSVKRARVTKGKRNLYEEVKKLYSSLDDEISHTFNNTDSKILEHDVKTFLQKIEDWITSMENDKDKLGMTMKSTCKVKIYLHSSRFLVMKFEAHNDENERKFGIQARLRKKKLEAKERFFAMVDDRSAEERAIMSLRNVIMTSVRDYIRTEMTSAVVNILLGKIIPITKYILMINLVRELVQYGASTDWSQYFSFPDTYAKSWIAKRANEHLFGKKGEYNRQAITKLKSTFSHIRCAIRESLQEESGKVHLAIEEFVTKTNLPIPYDAFNVVIHDFEEIKSLGNIEDLRKQLIEEIDIKETEIKEEMKTLNASDVVWHGSNPYDEVFDRVWGCVEKCPFCRESCAREKLHDGINHYCIQHRIKGCIGIHIEGTGEIVLHSCSYAVQSEETHACGVFQYACNDVKSPCSRGSHKYKDYKTYFPNWDIAPNPNMDDTSKVWMWFMANFKDDLKDDSIKVDNIPVRWNTITQDEAIKSYNAVMGFLEHYLSDSSN